MPARNITMAEYQGIRALSAGGAWTLSEVCPAKYWHESPWNPDYKPTNAAHFDVGTAAHLAVLEPELMAERIVGVPFETYHTKEARALRDTAYDTGRTPLKPSEYELVLNIRDAIARRPKIAELFTGGRAELTIEWETDGVPCKARPDYLAKRRVVDLKTVSSAHPRAASLAALQHGWHVRAPWYLEGVNQSRQFADDLVREYWFVCVEKTPPYLCEVYRLDPRAIAWGEQIIRRALKLFREYSGGTAPWPGYNGEFQGTPATLELPSWAEYALADRDQAGEFSR